MQQVGIRNSAHRRTPLAQALIGGSGTSPGPRRLLVNRSRNTDFCAARIVDRDDVNAGPWPAGQPGIGVAVTNVVGSKTALVTYPTKS